jgi:hypothetical protein
MKSNVAAIDVGSEKMHVAIAGGEVKVFDCFTDSLHQLKDHLKSQGVISVAMEATGVYWLPIFVILEGAGLEVVVVNGAHVKNVPGRKTDMQDCQWLAQLHAQGLLRGGFVPTSQIRTLRQYVRLRQDHVRSASEQIQHMQKAMDLMNIKLHDVLSETVGVNCLRMIRAIVAGQRNPKALVELCDSDVAHRKSQLILRALEGTWDTEHLFTLKQSLEAWDFYQQLIKDCDREIEQVLKGLALQKPEPAEGQSATVKKLKHNAPKMDDLEGLLHRLTGVDLNALPCLSA